MKPIDTCDIEANLGYNIRRAVMPMIFLQHLSAGETSIYEIVEDIKTQSNGTIVPANPYAVVRRLAATGYITEVGSRYSAADGRLRKAYTITPAGKEALEEYVRIYRSHAEAVNSILLPGESE